MSATSDAEVATEVIAAENERLAAIRAGDWARFSGVVGDDLVYTKMDGALETKADYLDVLQASPRTYTRNNLVVRVFGDVAVMHGGIQVTVAAQPDGTPERVRTGTILQVWAKRDDRWQLVAAQATDVPKERH